MMERKKIRLAYPVIVEGKYDRQRVLSVADAKVFQTDGFGIFKNTEKRALFRRLSEASPLIVLTDSDGAGKVIRGHLKGCVPPDRLIQLYIPQIPGKEKRKAEPSAEGFLGVEGMESSLLYDLLLPYDVGNVVNAPAVAGERPLSKADLYEDKLTGHAESAARRDELAVKLGLPRGMTPNAFLEALRLLLSYEEYLALVGRVPKNEDRDAIV